MASNLSCSRLGRLALIAVCVPGVSALAGSPVGWRQDGAGRFPHATPPVHWSQEENVVWKTPLSGRSYGSPIIVGEKIFVASDPADLLCLSRGDGKLLWRRSNSYAEVFGEDKARELIEKYDKIEQERKRLGRERKELQKQDPPPAKKLEEINQRLKALNDEFKVLRREHPLPSRGGWGSGNSAATPASDGQHVAAVFATGIVAVYSGEGQRRWIKFVQASPQGFGHTCSPLLVEDKVIVHFNDLVALDVNSGNEVWRTETRSAYATPLVTSLGGERVLVTPGGAVVRARDGKLLAELPLRSSESSPVIHNGVIYVSGNGAIAAFKLANGDDGPKAEELWRTTASRERRTPSSVYHDGLLYAVTTNGILEVIDAQAGKSVYRKRLSVGKVYSSATMAGGFVYVHGTGGKTLVIKPGRKFEQAALNTLEGAGSSPVFEGQRMYLRTRGHLYCVAEKK